jgi:hypothetical protein
MHSSLVCANCGITIEWQPTIVDEKPFCCHGCVEGGPCECDYGNLPQVGGTRAMALARVPGLGKRPKGETR